ncbi:MAG: MFS transporter [Chloroflexi bacterium]|nr:MFS transporter [Chloroflexota bacterium]
MQIGRLLPGFASPREVTLSLGDNWRQFTLLVTVNLFVGGMIGMERSILPGLAEAEFGITSKTAIVSFIATFGLAKAVTNLFAGNLAQRVTRRRILISGWLFAIPVPLMLIWAPSWGWVIAANVLLGINQGLTWSMTVNMKMDLVGPRWRGVALGFNEAAGYLSLAAVAFLTGVIAEAYGLRPEPFYLGIGIAATGLAFSVLLVRDTAPYLALENASRPGATSVPSSLKGAFADVTWRKPYLFGITQAGLVKNLNDGVAWGIFPLYFASQGLELNRIATLVAVYPLAWGALQLATGWASDLLGRKPLIVIGMALQGAAISMTAAFDSFPVWIATMSLLGLGTALVYPTLQAAISDAVPAIDRATALGVYRFWRDSGFIFGAFLAGALADLFGFSVAIQFVAALTVASGVVAQFTVRGKRAVVWVD